MKLKLTKTRLKDLSESKSKRKLPVENTPAVAGGRRGVSNIGRCLSDFTCDGWYC
ncbi:hypothetical protein ACSLBF_21000 (plasmid) [Pseudoalteromonas sp. T1lg65]|uniref:hypothetical protein n=1 Tax=Pseudoalteromonas sp. T1lg65 TaxID=2077101 RepID=UPI003F79D021